MTKMTCLEVEVSRVHRASHAVRLCDSSWKQSHRESWFPQLICTAGGNHGRSGAAGDSVVLAAGGLLKSIVFLAFDEKAGDHGDLQVGIPGPGESPTCVLDGRS